MTQRALAEAVGLRQSNIAAIEAGDRAVSADMLERILVAADYRPALSLRQHAAALKKLGAELGVTNIRVFGSVARGQDHYSSDVDLLVGLEPSTVPSGCSRASPRSFWVSASTWSSTVASVPDSTAFARWRCRCERSAVGAGGSHC